LLRLGLLQTTETTENVRAIHQYVTTPPLEVYDNVAMLGYEHLRKTWVTENNRGDSCLFLVSAHRPGREASL
jgi:hypothetical protein